MVSDGPDEAVLRMRRELQDLVEALATSRIELDRLIGSATQYLATPGVDPHTAIEYIPMDQVRPRVEQIAFACQREVWALLLEPGPSQESVYAAAKPANDDSIRRGIRMRAIVPAAVHKYPASLAHISHLVKMGAEYRVVPSVAAQMWIVDQELALVVESDFEGVRGGYLITAPAVVTLLADLYRALWRSAEPLATDGEVCPDTLSSQELAVLRAWLRGATDGQVARTLGISERTVRRVGEALMERLGASSRFELGARAVYSGHLTGDDLL